jgi:ABC-2 type transport system permease protein
MLPIIFVLPIVQLLILTYATDFELKNINFTYVDHDQSATSKSLLSHFQNSPYFIDIGASVSHKDGMHQLDENKASLVINIPRGMEQDLYRGQSAKIALDVNSIDGQAATLSFNYASNIIHKFNGTLAQNSGLRSTDGLRVSERYWYNPSLEYSNLMVPGILALLVTMIALFLSAMNVVREKEIGTIEQINVTPIKKSQFLIGKLLPFWVIAMGEMAFGLFIGKLLFDIPMRGSLFLLFAFTALYLIVILAMGLWVSTITGTQQQAMFISWFFAVIFILMSGLFTPIENMPVWAQQSTLLNPVAYMVKVLRSILLKGSNFRDIQFEFVAISAYALSMLSIAVLSYRKRA